MQEDAPLSARFLEGSRNTFLPETLAQRIKQVYRSFAFAWLAGVMAIGVWCFTDFLATDYYTYATYGTVLCVIFPVNAASVVYAFKSRHICDERRLFLQSWYGLCVCFFTMACNVVVVVWAIGLWSGHMQWLMQGGVWLAFPVIMVQAILGHCDCLVTATRLCQKHVQEVIGKIDDPAEVDWDRLVEEVFDLQERLADVWKFKEVAAPVFMGVGSGVVCLSVCLVFQITGCGGVGMLSSLFVVGCVYVAGPLSLLAYISSICRDTVAVVSARSIPGAASRRVNNFTKMPEKERVAYDRFLRLVLSEANPLRITFCGVRITMGLVVTTFLKVAIGFPAAYGVLKRMLANAQVTHSTFPGQKESKTL